MKMRKILALILCFALSFSFTGCAIVDMDVRNMMAAPKNDADMAAVTNILDSGGRADYCYPQSGDYREAVIFGNFTGLSRKDAISFTYDTSKRILISFFNYRDGKWSKTADFTDKADFVDRIIFGDITGDGLTDIIVGFTDAEDRNVISIFSFFNEVQEIRKIDTKFYYDNLLCTRFRSTERDELCVIRKEITNDEKSDKMVFSVYQYNNKKFYSLGSERLTTRLTEFEHVFFDKDADGKSYVAVEGKSLSGNYITQIITENSYNERFYSPYSVNPERSIPGEFKRNGLTKLLSMDIDGDGSKEIPYMTQVKISGVSSSGYITDWVKPSLKNLSKITVESSVVSVEQNFYFLIREEDKDNIAFFNGSDDDSMDVYYIETDEQGVMEKSQKLFTVRVFTKPQWKEYTDGKSTEYSLVLDSRGDAVYAVKDLFRCESSEYMIESFNCIE